jgi:hypothetical protein
MSRSFGLHFGITVGMLGLMLLGGCLQGCSVNNDVPPRAAPIGTPTNPPPPRLEGHTPPPNATK